MPDAIDKVDLISDLLIDRAEAVTSQMKLVVDQLREILNPEASTKGVANDN